MKIFTELPLSSPAACSPHLATTLRQRQTMLKTIIQAYVFFVFLGTLMTLAARFLF